MSSTSSFEDPNAFAKTYNEWAALANARAQRTGGMGIDAREPVLWREAKRAFERLKKITDALYRG